MPSVPIYDVLIANSAVKALLGNPPRIYGFGRAPNDVVKPYVVWQVITGSPENNLSDRPEYDNYNIQVDVYGDTELSVENVALALRNAIEEVTHITGWYGESRDRDTDMYRFTFAVDWFVNR